MEIGAAHLAARSPSAVVPAFRADDDGAEICYVLYVAQMTWDDAAAEGGATCDADSAMAISQAAGRPRSPAAQEGGGAVCRTVSPPPPPGHVEVPRCPVCRRAIGAGSASSSAAAQPEQPVVRRYSNRVGNAVGHEQHAPGERVHGGRRRAELGVRQCPPSRVRAVSAPPGQTWVRPPESDDRRESL